MRTGFQSLKIDVLDSLANADGTKVAIDCTSEGARADGSHYANEYIFIFHLNKDGKIFYVNEFLDSAYVGISTVVGQTSDSQIIDGIRVSLQTRKALKMPPLE